MFRWERWIWGFTLDSRHYIMHPWSLDRLNEEMKYMLKQSKVCQEVFWTPFGRGKDQLLNFRVHAPIPGNNFYKKNSTDNDCIEDLVTDHLTLLYKPFFFENFSKKHVLYRNVLFSVWGHIVKHMESIWQSSCEPHGNYGIRWCCQIA